jgi:hypothetical protein
VPVGVLNPGTAQFTVTVVDWPRYMGVVADTVADSAGLTSTVTTGDATVVPELSVTFAQ